MNSNRTVVDLGKVSYANFFYRTQDNCHTRRVRPKYPTVHNTRIDDEQLVCEGVQSPDGRVWLRETALERAKKRNLLDVWIPHCVVQLSNSHSLSYTGKKAVSIWKEWNSRQFGKQKGN